MNAPIGSVWIKDFPRGRTTVLVLGHYIYYPVGQTGSAPQDWLKVLRLPGCIIYKWPDLWFDSEYQDAGDVDGHAKMTRLL